VGQQIIRSTCGICQAGCGILVHVKDSRPHKIEGDPNSPVNKGWLCSKGLAGLEYLEHPQRLTSPLKRKGEKGSGQWQEIPWDEALGIIAEQFQATKDRFGPESIVFMRGSFKGGYDGTFLARFANVFGAPNIASMAPVCYVPRVYGSVFTHGYNPVPDYEYPPRCVVMWGANLRATRIGEYRKTLDALNRGAKLIVVDPRKFDLAHKPDMWLQLRPGTDLAFALALVHVIITEKLYDTDFVDKWTIGFEQLCQHVSGYSPEKVENIAWVPAHEIREMARMYCSFKPAVIQAGNAIDHNQNNFQTARALAILRAISGNLGIPGGELECSSPPVRPTLGSPELDLRDQMPLEMRDKRLDAQTGMLPNVFYARPQSIVKAILEQEPYPLRLGYVQGGNLLLTYPNSTQVAEAFKKLDFLVVVDMFMSPTAAIADIVLPVRSYLEFDAIISPPYYPIAQVQQKTAQVGQCKSDFEIITDLARKLGLANFFWEDFTEWLDFVLEPSGLKFDEFRHMGVLEGTKQYRKYQRDGFNTPSSKVELYSERLAQWGFDPLPQYRELPETPYSDPGIAEKFPLIFTSWKAEQYRHTSGRQIPSLRRIQPEPLVWIHPDTASRHGIREGDWVLIKTNRGGIKQKAYLTNQLDPRVIGVDYGWWYPEKGPESSFGWQESNINMLTDDGAQCGKELGTPNLRGTACSIQKF